MDEIYEARRVALKAMIDRMGRGSITLVAGKIGVDPSYLSRCLYPPGKAGKKNIGDEVVTKLDDAYPGWMRNPPKVAILGQPQSARDKRLAELNEIAGQIDDDGLAELVGMAKILTIQKPVGAKQTAASSA